MKSNYDILGNHIRLIDDRNNDLVTDQVLGINIDKFFMPSVANIIGTDLSKYKLVTKGKFACNPMHVGRDERLPIALYEKDTPAIVSPAYFVFEIIDNTILDENFLMMWFRRPEFDRICWLHTDGSVRGGITWEDICRLEMLVPSIEEQKNMVRAYRAINDRIVLKKQINDNLFTSTNAFFSEKFGSYLCERMRNTSQYVHLNKFLKIKHGFAFNSDFFSEEVTKNILISPGNFKIGGGFQNNKPKYYMEDAPYSNDFILSSGSLVVTMTDLSKNGDTLGFPAIIPKDDDIVFLHNQRVGLVEFTTSELPKAFIYFLMCSTDYRNYILSTASGTTVRHTSPQKILQYGFIMPENCEDLKELSCMFEIYVRYSNNLNREIKLLAKMESLLLSKLVN